MECDMTDLVNTWQTLLAKYTSSVHATNVGRALVFDWSRPDRYHHNVAHLRAVLTHVDELAHHATDPDLVRLAGWYHDAVYNCRPGDEENSALRAERELRALDLKPAAVSEVGRLVRLTRTHSPADGDRNGEALCDADLAILGASPLQYDAYAQAIRAEYSQFSDDEFRIGRTQALQALLAAPSLFHTPLGHQRWEAAARANITLELHTITLQNTTISTGEP